MSLVESGSPQGIRIRGREFFVWWGEDAEGTARVEARGRQVVSFPTRDECLSWASRTGLGVDGEAETGTLECDALTPWLDRAVSTPDYTLALDIVNMSIDVSGSVGETWDPRDGRTGRVYDTLFAASMPWFFGMDVFRPRWSVYELALARSVVQRSMALLGRALIGADSAHEETMRR